MRVTSIQFDSLSVKRFPNVLAPINWRIFFGKEPASVNYSLNRDIFTKPHDVLIGAEFYVRVEREHTWPAELHQKPELVFIQVGGTECAAIAVLLSVE